MARAKSLHGLLMLAAATPAGAVTFLEALPRPFLRSPARAPGETQVQFLGPDDGDVMTSFPFMKASSCLLVACLALDFEFRDIILFGLFRLDRVV